MEERPFKRARVASWSDHEDKYPYKDEDEDGGLGQGQGRGEGSLFALALASPTWTVEVWTRSGTRYASP